MKYSLISGHGYVLAKLSFYKFVLIGIKTIDIITSHNVGIDYEAATVMNRGVASFLDLLVMLAYYLIVFFASLAFGLETWDFSMATVIFYILMLPVLFYSVLMEYLLKGQTVGKLAMGIRVIKLNGENATLSDYAMRGHSVSLIFGFQPDLWLLYLLQVQKKVSDWVIFWRKQQS